MTVNESENIDFADIQGNILRGYGKRFVRHLVLTVNQPAAARQWLSDAVSGDSSLTHQITNAELWEARLPTCLNVGITYTGLAALGTPQASLDSFPHDFVAGMAARNVMIGDTGPSDPVNWKYEWRHPERVHLLVSVHADDAVDRDLIAEQILARDNAFKLLAELDGEGFAGGKVHFGFKDSIAQPQFYGVHDGPDSRRDDQPLVEIGAMLLGHRTPIENLRWEVPVPEVLGFNGSFNAFRVLEQRVEEFEEFLTECANHPEADQLLPPGIEETWDPPVSRHEALRETIAAKIVGRWRNGVALAVSPYTPTPQPPVSDKELNNFGYADDPDGLRCPIGSHLRRSNPRDAKTVQRNTNHARRIIRRGIPYGPLYDPANPVSAERGLLGSFMCASLTGQFEALLYDWTNLGLLDPRVTGSNDPMLGNNDPQFSRMTLPFENCEVTFRGFSRFIHTRGGAYLFQPSISAIRYLASLSGNGKDPS